MAQKESKLPVYSWETHGEGSWFAYKRGYLKAIDTLIETATDDKGAYINNLFNSYGFVYPIAFLCRHYIEIELKQTIALASLMGFANKNKRFGHKLTPLWLEVLHCVENARGKETRTDFESDLGHLITFFEQVDPQADGFRYPKNMNERAHWANSFEIDVAKLKRDIDLFKENFDELLRELKQMLDPDADDMSSRYYFY